MYRSVPRLPRRYAAGKAGRLLTRSLTPALWPVPGASPVRTRPIGAVRR